MSEHGHPVDCSTIAAEVNPDRRLTPPTLRAYLARYNIAPRELAVRLDVTSSAITKALRADLTARPYSQSLMRRILDAANAILLEREESAQ